MVSGWALRSLQDCVLSHIERGLERSSGGKGGDQEQDQEQVRSRVAEEDDGDGGGRYGGDVRVWDLGDEQGQRRGRIGRERKRVKSEPPVMALVAWRGGMSAPGGTRRIPWRGGMVAQWREQSGACATPRRQGSGSGIDRVPGVPRWICTSMWKDAGANLVFDSFADFGSL